MKLIKCSMCVCFYVIHRRPCVDLWLWALKIRCTGAHACDVSWVTRKCGIKRNKKCFQTEYNVNRVFIFSTCFADIKWKSAFFKSIYWMKRAAFLFEKRPVSIFFHSVSFTLFMCLICQRIYIWVYLIWFLGQMKFKCRQSGGLFTYEDWPRCRHTIITRLQI